MVNKTTCQALKNHTTVLTLINKITEYSPKKIKANTELLNSILKPETSSDSPSAKSNGARFVSAIVVTTQTIHRGSKSRAHINESIAFSKFIVNINAEGNIITKNILTSYEIV